MNPFDRQFNQYERLRRAKQERMRRKAEEQLRKTVETYSLGGVLFNGKIVMQKVKYDPATIVDIDHQVVHPNEAMIQLFLRKIEMAQTAVDLKWICMEIEDYEIRNKVIIHKEIMERMKA